MFWIKLIAQIVPLSLLVVTVITYYEDFNIGWCVALIVLAVAAEFVILLAE